MRTVVLLDSISAIEASHAGALVVSGSHGGVSAARFVVNEPARPYAVFFNDAGVGKDEAGIVGLAMVQACGVIGAAYSHRSARIGEAADGLASGELSHLNAQALTAGLRVGMRVNEAVRHLGAAA
jgi:hypothetical protein